MRLTTRNKYTGKAILRDLPNYEEYDPIERLAEYEDTDLTPEEFKESVDFTLELNKKLRNIVKDLIKEYESRYEYYENDSSWDNGAIEALEELLRRLNT